MKQILSFSIIAHEFLIVEKLKLLECVMGEVCSE